MMYYYDPQEISNNTSMLSALLEKTKDCDIRNKIKEYLSFGKRVTRKDFNL